MCFEMVSAMKNIFGNVECLVVSKTGKFGRKNILADKIAKSYGLDIKSIDYDFFNKISAKYKDYFIIHHRLECTKPLNFIVKPKKYIVVNHTIQKTNRIRNFTNADVIVSVCEYLKNSSPKIKQNHIVILNGIKENKEVCKKEGFITGRCHRFPSSKFNINSLKFLDSLKIDNHIHYLAGTDNNEIDKYIRKNTKTCIKYVGKIDNQQEKMRMIKSFDVYFYDTYGPEGASVAILEALSSGVPVLCKPLGGNKELVKNGVNGFYYKDFSEAKKILVELSNNKTKLDELKEKTINDFRNRLSIETCVSNYKELICQTK